MEIDERLEIYEMNGIEALAYMADGKPIARGRVAFRIREDEDGVRRLQVWNQEESAWSTMSCGAVDWWVAAEGFVPLYVYTITPYRGMSGEPLDIVFDDLWEARRKAEECAALCGDCDRFEVTKVDTVDWVDMGTDYIIVPPGDIPGLYNKVGKGWGDTVTWRECLRMDLFGDDLPTAHEDPDAFIDEVLNEVVGINGPHDGGHIIVTNDPVTFRWTDAVRPVISVDCYRKALRHVYDLEVDSLEDEE